MVGCFSKSSHVWAFIEVPDSGSHFPESGLMVSRYWLDRLTGFSRPDSYFIYLFFLLCQIWTLTITHDLKFGIFCTGFFVSYALTRRIWFGFSSCLWPWFLDCPWYSPAAQLKWWSLGHLLLFWVSIGKFRALIQMLSPKAITETEGRDCPSYLFLLLNIHCCDFYVHWG